MAVQTGRSSPPLDRLKEYFWWTEQKLATLLAIVLGTFVGLALGAVHATKSLAPHLTSVAGAKRLYYGDPASSLSQQSRAYVNKNFSTAKLKPSGHDAILSSTPAEKTATPTMMNGDSTSHATGKTSEFGNPAADGTASYAGKVQESAAKTADQAKDYAMGTYESAKDYTYKATSDAQDYTSKTASGAQDYASKTASEAKASLPKEITPGEEKSSGVSGGMYGGEKGSGVSAITHETEGDEGETETEDEAGSEYTASSTPTTPRSSVLAPTDTANGGEKKKKKKLGKRIKKTLSKVVDAITPSTHTSS